MLTHIFCFASVMVSVSGKTLMSHIILYLLKLLHNHCNRILANANYFYHISPLVRQLNIIKFDDLYFSESVYLCIRCCIIYYLNLFLNAL